MAKTPSSTMTRKMDFTTEFVVFSPSDSGATLHLQSLDAGDDADDQRHERRLDHSHFECGAGDGFAQPREKDLRLDAPVEP